jgi:Cu2+-exporting ATPase
LTIPRATDFQAIPGHGVQANVEGRIVADGGPNLLKKLGLEPPAEIRQFADAAASRGQSVIYHLEDQRVLAALPSRTQFDQSRPKPSVGYMMPASRLRW